MATIPNGVYQIRNVHHSRDNLIAMSSSVLLKAGDTTTWSVRFDSGTQAYFLRYQDDPNQTLTLPPNAQPGTQLTVTNFISSRGQQWFIQPSANGTYDHIILTTCSSLIILTNLSVTTM